MEATAERRDRGEERKLVISINSENIGTQLWLSIIWDECGGMGTNPPRAVTSGRCRVGALSGE
jgi:hypothetical protein